MKWNADQVVFAVVVVSSERKRKSKKLCQSILVIRLGKL